MARKVETLSVGLLDEDLDLRLEEVRKYLLRIGRALAPEVEGLWEKSLIDGTDGLLLLARDLCSSIEESRVHNSFTFPRDILRQVSIDEVEIPKADTWHFNGNNGCAWVALLGQRRDTDGFGEETVRVGYIPPEKNLIDEQVRKAVEEEDC